MEFLRGDTTATMKSIPVSVVMSVFNGQAFLGQAIESVLGQSFVDFEFLIVSHKKLFWIVKLCFFNLVLPRRSVVSVWKIGY